MRDGAELGYACVMAMTGTVIPEMARVSGLLPSTVDRIIRDIRAAGMAPMGQHGRGQTYGQFDNFHLSNLILAFAGAQPSDAANAVKTLSQLGPEDLTAGSSTLGTRLAIEIAARAHHVLRGNYEYLRSNEQDWELTLCLDPVIAWMTWTVDGTEKLQYYHTFPQAHLSLNPQEPTRGIRRLTIITVDVLNVAAELCADTISRREGQQNLPIPEASTKTSAKTENGDLPGSPPIQDPQSMIPHSPSREFKRAGAIRQAASNGGPGLFHQKPRITSHAENRPAY